MLAFLLGAGAGIALGVVARIVETSRLALGPYAFYGNGALIVPALGSGLALYALWTWAFRAGRPRIDLLWSALGVHLGLGAGLFATGGTSLAGVFFTGVLFVLPAALVAFIVLTVLEPRLAASLGGPRTNALLLTALVVAGLFLAVVPFPPLGIGLITGAFTSLGRRATPGATIGLGALLVVVLLAAGLAVPLLFMR
ncbi:MAG TPA: hypothetical protein VFM06_07100 [Candidatus Limnocylindria bacterium]|nr:hypothetical protein [Candidatus Limnocylindria bacterium]